MKKRERERGETKKKRVRVSQHDPQGSKAAL
jgi:hypothetical protein